EASVVATTALYTRRIEAAVRANPEQWNWMGLPRRDGKMSRAEMARAAKRSGTPRRGTKPRSMPIERRCGSSSAELGIEARIQNRLFLGRFQITDKAVFVFDLIEAQRRQIFRLAGIDLDREQSQFVA